MYVTELCHSYIVKQIANEWNTDCSSWVEDTSSKRRKIFEAGVPRWKTNSPAGAWGATAPQTLTRICENFMTQNYWKFHFCKHFIYDSDINVRLHTYVHIATSSACNLLLIMAHYNGNHSLLFDTIHHY